MGENIGRNRWRVFQICLCRDLNYLSDLIVITLDCHLPMGYFHLSSPMNIAVFQPFEFIQTRLLLLNHSVFVPDIRFERRSKRISGFSVSGTH